MRVRIWKTPIEQEVDGVQLDYLTPGRVCDVSTSLGSWLLTEKYAVLEMRSSAADESDFTSTPKERGSSSINEPPQFANDRRRRRR